MANNFLYDLHEGELFEIEASRLLGIAWQGYRDEDDKGVDLFGIIECDELDLHGEIMVDVKAYKAPLFVKSFKGVFIEYTSGKRKNPGWFKKENLTTHYLMFTDCVTDGLSIVQYKRLFLISKENLRIAIDDANFYGDLEQKEIATAGGVILPYEYLTKYGYELDIRKLKDK